MKNLGGVLSIGAYLAEWRSFSGRLDAKRYGALQTPLVVLASVLNVAGLLLAEAIDWSVGGWLILIALVGLTLSSLPLYVRRARNIGWNPILTGLLAIGASVSYFAFASLPLSTGFWRALNATDVPLIGWGLLFAAILGFWFWCWRSLLDRPSRAVV